MLAIIIVLMSLLGTMAIIDIYQMLLGNKSKNDDKDL